MLETPGPQAPVRSEALPESTEPNWTPRAENRTCVNDHLVMYASLALLVLSTADTGLLGSVIKLSWLASLAVLVFINVGGALAVYIASLAIYSGLHFGGWGSPLQRPDDYALPILCAGVLATFPGKRSARHQVRAWVLAFAVFASLNTAILGVSSRVGFAGLMRAICIPFLLSELYAAAGLGERELGGFINGMLAFGSYAGLISVLERVNAYDWILPPWIGDLSLNEWLDTGRSGGVMMQPAWTALLLALTISLWLLQIRNRPSLPGMIAMASCAAGLFFSYCRGAWLGFGLSLLWLPGWCVSAQQALLRRVTLVCAASLFLLWGGGKTAERLHDTGTVFYRFGVWGAGLRLAISHPVLGVGFGNFPSAMETVEQGFGDLVSESQQAKEGDAAHNTILTVLAEFGALGFVLYIAAFRQFVRTALTGARRLWGNSGAVWVTAFVILYVVNAQFVADYDFTTNVMFFGFLGVVAGARPSSLAASVETATGEA